MPDFKKVLPSLHLMQKRPLAGEEQFTEKAAPLYKPHASEPGKVPEETVLK